MGPRNTGMSSRVRAAVRWFGRVLLHGAGAGGAHGATLFTGAWLVVSLATTGIDDDWTLVWWLNVGPAVWIAVAMRRLAGRWDPVEAGRRRPPLPRDELGAARFPR